MRKIYTRKPKNPKEGDLWIKETKKGKVLLKKTEKDADEFGTWTIIKSIGKDESFF